MKKSKKSYMNVSNILSEKITLGGALKYLTSLGFIKSVKKVDDKKIQKRLKDINKTVDELAALLKKQYGSDVTMPKYTMKDLKGEKGEK
jgi:hypothetical protein